MADRARLAGFLVAALAAVTTLAGCGGSDPAADGPGITRPDNGGYHGTFLGGDPFVVADVPLDDTAGQKYSIATSDKKLKVVFFGYTMCPDICQVVMSTISTALTRLDDAQRDQVEAVFVTTDPARDSEKVLREYLDRFSPSGLVGLTGPLADIVRLGDSLKVSITDGRKLPSGGYEVDHTTYTFGVLGDGAEVIWDAQTSPADMAADIIKLLKS